MTLKRLAVAMILAVSLNTLAPAAMNKITNPADKISNPADKMYNPATLINNPAANIYNPATRMDNPDPLSPPTQPVPQPVVPEVTTTVNPVKQNKENVQPQPRPAVPQKSYYFKTVKEYIAAAKKAFIQDDYREFISLTEDALKRINAGTLKASAKSRKKLEKFKVVGYGLLEMD